MKRTTYTAILVVAVIAAIFIGRTLFRTAESKSSITSDPTDSLPITTVQIIDKASDVSPELPAAPEEKMSSEMTQSFAKKVLAAMPRGGLAIQAALDPSLLWDNSVPFELRRQLVWQLVHSDDPADFQLLTQYISSPNADLKVTALIIESLSESSNPQARELILSALDLNNDLIVRSALRGLAGLDNPSDIKLFSTLLFSEKTSSSIRAEAAVALGALSSPKAGEILMSAYRAASPEDEALLEALINGLGQRDIAQTETFFKEVLAEETDPSLRLNIVESISNAKGDTSQFLIDCLSDADSDIRAEALWNMSMLEGDYGKILSELLCTESNPEVRQRLYEALDGQENVDVPLVLERSLQEEDVESQLAAYTLIATHLDEIDDPQEREDAEFVLINEFEKMAINSATLNQRLRAVVGLQRIQTAKADAAIERIVGQSSDPRIIRATRKNIQSLMSGER